MASEFVIKGIPSAQLEEYLSTAVRNSAQSLAEAKNRYLSANAAYDAVAAQASDPAPEGLPASQYADLQKGAVTQAGFARLDTYLQHQRAIVSHESLVAERARLAASGV